MSYPISRITVLFGLATLLSQCAIHSDEDNPKTQVCKAFPVQVNDPCFDAMEVDRIRNNPEGIIDAFSSLEATEESPSTAFQQWTGFLEEFGNAAEVPSAGIPPEMKNIDPATFLGWVSTGQTRPIELHSSGKASLFRSYTPILDTLTRHVVTSARLEDALVLAEIESALQRGEHHRASQKASSLTPSPAHKRLQRSLVTPPSPQESILRDDLGIAHNKLARHLHLLDESTDPWLQQWLLQGVVVQGLTGWDIEHLAPYCDGALRHTSQLIRIHGNQSHPLDLRRWIGDAVEMGMKCYRSEGLGDVLEHAFDVADQREGLQGLLLWVEVARHWFVQWGSGEGRALLTRAYLYATRPIPSENSITLARILRDGLHQFLESTQKSSGQMYDSLRSTSRRMDEIPPTETDTWIPYIPTLQAGIAGLKAWILGQAGEVYRAHQELDAAERNLLESSSRFQRFKDEEVRVFLAREGLAILRSTLDSSSVPSYPTTLLEPCKGTQWQPLCGMLVRASAFRKGSSFSWESYRELIERNWLPKPTFPGLAGAIQSAYEDAGLPQSTSLKPSEESHATVDSLRRGWKMASPFSSTPEMVRPFDGTWAAPSPNDLQVVCTWTPSEAHSLNSLAFQFTHSEWMEEGIRPKETLYLSNVAEPSQPRGWSCKSVRFWNAGRQVSSWLHAAENRKKGEIPTGHWAQQMVDTLALLIPGSSAMENASDLESLQLSRQSLPLMELASWTMTLRAEGQLQVAQDLESLIRTLLEATDQTFSSVPSPAPASQAHPPRIPWDFTRAWYNAGIPHTSEAVRFKLESLSPPNLRAVFESILHVQNGERHRAAVAARKAVRGIRKPHLLHQWQRLTEWVQNENSLSETDGEAFLREAIWEHFPAERLGTALLLIRLISSTDREASLTTLLSPLLEKDLKRPDSLQAINLIRQTFPIVAGSLKSEELGPLLESIVRTGTGRLAPKDLFQWRVGSLQQSMRQPDAKWTADAFLPLVLESRKERVNPPSFLRALRLWVLGLLVAENRATEEDFAQQFAHLPASPELKPVQEWAKNFITLSTSQERTEAAAELGQTLFGLTAEPPQPNEVPKADSTDSSKSP